MFDGRIVPEHNTFSSKIFLREALFPSVGAENLVSVLLLLRPENNCFLRGGYGGWYAAPGHQQFEALIFKDPKVERR